MSRYNKIYAGPYTEALPQTREGLASEDIIPGALVTFSAGEFSLADATTVGTVWVAQDNYLTLKTVDDVNKTGNTMIGMIMLQTQLFNCLVPTGQNLVVGDELTSDANGLLVKAAAGDRVFAMCEEDYNNDTGDSQLVHVRAVQGYIRAAA